MAGCERALDRGGVAMKALRRRYGAARKAKLDADTQARALLDAYYDRYIHNVGLRAHLPRMAVGMMREFEGWPVRNPDGGANIAYFSTADAAQSAVSACDRKYRSAVQQ